jgi:hypothetical protein
MNANLTHFFNKWIILCLILLLPQIFSVREIDMGEFNSCKEINPTKISDCTVGRNYTTIICCYFNMTYPGSGDICVPFTPASTNLKGRVDVKLPVNINITGDFDCTGDYFSKSRVVINLLIILFITYYELV